MVLIRFPTQARIRLPAAILELVAHHADELIGHFVVISPGRVRIARIQMGSGEARWNEEIAGWGTQVAAFRRLQEEIAQCDECVKQWPNLVTRPLTREIPDPPAHVDILFVGVAPTADEGRSKGTHFYSDSCDNLRSGLFRLLSEPAFSMGLTNLGLGEGNKRFHEARCFFVHAAKVRPRIEDHPPKDLLGFCAARHLAKEIDTLKPRAICFLGKTRLPKEMFHSLFGCEVSGTARSVTRRNGWSGLAVLTNQPVRGQEGPTRVALQDLWARNRRRES